MPRPRAPRWQKSRSFGSAREHRSAAAEGSTDDWGGNAGGALRREIDSIKEARLTAGQIKTELDALGLGYAGLLEKSEYVRALAEARVEAADGSLEPQGQQEREDIEQEPREEEQDEVGESSVEGSESVGGGEPSAPSKQAGVSSNELAAEATPEPQVEPLPDSVTRLQSVEEGVPEAGSAPPKEPEPRAVPVPESPPASDSVVQEEPVKKSAPEPAADSGEELQTEKPAKSQQTPTTSSFDSARGGEEGEGAGDDVVEKEILRIWEARMTAGQIKSELDSLSVGYVGLLEKAEFVRRLAEARTSPGTAGARDGDGGEDKGGGDKNANATAQEVVDDGAGAEAAGGTTTGDEEVSPDDEATGQDPVVPGVGEKESEPPTPPSAEEANGEPTGKGAVNKGVESGRENDDVGVTESVGVREEVSAMRTSQIKQELDERGVPYRGLLEKSEFVDALVDARARGITATASSDDGGGKATAADEDGAENVAGAKKNNGGFDPSYKDVEMKKMKQDSDGRQGAAERAGASGATPGGGASDSGGFDIGSILGTMGGTGGAGAGGGGAGGFDIGSILGALGGMGGATSPGGATPPGGAGPGTSDLLSMLMNNPKAQAVLQKVQSNPKVMSAIQDVSQNGLGAIAKYQDDPEILGVIEDLKSLF